MANPFDQFDAPRQPTSVQIKGANPMLPGQVAGQGITNTKGQQSIQYGPYERGDKLRGDFDKRQQVQDYRTAWPILMSAMKSVPDANGDLSLIYSYAKAMDPGSVVRESEMGMAQGTGGYLENAVAGLKKQLGYKDGGLLSPEVRSRLKRDLNTRVAQYAKAYGVARREFQQRAKRQGVDPQDVVGDFPASGQFGEYEKYRRALSGRQAPKKSGPVRINDDAGYDRLPSGAMFVGPDGVTRRKP